MALEVTDSNFQELRNSNRFMVLDFWARWCGPCRIISPLIDELSDKYEGVAAIGKMDVDANNEVVSLFGIRSIPTVLFFRDGVVVDKVVGAAQRETFIRKIEALIAG